MQLGRSFHWNRSTLTSQCTSKFLQNIPALTCLCPPVRANAHMKQLQPSQLASATIEIVHQIRTNSSLIACYNQIPMQTAQNVQAWWWPSGQYFLTFLDSWSGLEEWNCKLKGIFSKLCSLRPGSQQFWGIVCGFTETEFRLRRLGAVHRCLLIQSADCSQKLHWLVAGWLGGWTLEKMSRSHLVHQLYMNMLIHQPQATALGIQQTSSVLTERQSRMRCLQRGWVKLD